MVGVPPFPFRFLTVYSPGHSHLSPIVDFPAIETDAPLRRQAVEASSSQPAEAPEDDSPALIDLGSIVRQSPPYLISAVVHMLVLIIGALIFLAADFELPLDLEARYAEKIGDFDDIPNLDLPLTDELLDQQLTELTDQPIVSDPLSMPPISPIVPNAASLASAQASIAIGVELSGREPGMRESLNLAYGGTKLTQDAVEEGLKWLARNQQKNGSWSLVGPFRDGAAGENQQSATAMALLAFQGHGHTHKRLGDDPYSDVVGRGWLWLLGSQNSDGFFQGQMSDSQQLYTHAQCAIAICELYGMTNDPELREPAQKAIDYAVRIQTDKGGWRYYPGRDEDLSVTGWFAMAFQSARMAGLEVPSESLDRLSRYLDTVQKENGSQYAYRPSEGARPSMTAEGLLCRQYLGWPRDDERLEKGVDYLLDYLPNWDEGPNVYHWYYATQVCHHMEGTAWQKWNLAMRTTLPKNQEKGGKERGSWDPRTDRWGRQAGRLYVTCLSIYMLEVYYRHLPIYRDGVIGMGY